MRMIRLSAPHGSGAGAACLGSLQRVGLPLFLLLIFAPGLRPQAPASGSQEIPSHLQKAQQALQSRDFAAAEREFRAVLALDPNNLEVRGNIGVMRFFQNDWEGAAEQFRAVLTAQPENWKVEAYLGMCEGRRGQSPEARRRLAAALPHLADGPFKTQAGLELAQMEYQSGDLDGAVDVVRLLLPAHPRNVDVLYTAARVYADLADRSRDALLLTAPESARTRQLMAEMLINRGDARAAIVQYRQALQIDPKLPGIHYELGEAILQDSRQPPALQAAEKEFRAALAENPRDARAEYRLGTISSLRGDYQTAIEHYSRALEFQPNDAYAHEALGVAWVKMGKPEQALEQLVAATRLDPLDSTAHYQLSALYRSLGREADARRELAAFEELDKAKKQIDQVYIQTRGEFPSADSPGAQSPNK